MIEKVCKVSLYACIGLLATAVGATFQPAWAQTPCEPATDPDLNDDGIVSLVDLYIVTNSFDTTGKGASKTDPRADTNCDGVVDVTDVNFVRNAMGLSFPTGPEVDIMVATSPGNTTVELGDPANIATSINFTSSSDDTPFTIEVSQTIFPATGLILAPQVSGSVLTPSADFATTLNQESNSTEVGTYEVSTTATIVETGQSSTSVAQISVVSGDELELVINEPGSLPGALGLDAEVETLFTVQINGADADTVISVTLTEPGLPTSLSLNDMAQDGDLVANDGTYSGRLLVNTNGLAAGDCRTYQATATTSTGVKTSPPYHLCATGFPIGTQPSDLDNVVIDPLRQEPVIADEIIITVVNGTSEQVISDIAATVGGTVAGSIPGLGVYQIKLGSPVSDFAALEVLIASLLENAEISAAEANGVIQGTTVVPDDPTFAQQAGIKKIRADEAWYVARGATMIAVVDSGVDTDHPDLDAKIVPGKDFIDGGDPEDEHGHGTHVAGIAAAETDNGTGIAGVSWDSKLLIVRVLDQNKNGSCTGGADGIKEAADRGAKVINASFSAPSCKATLCGSVAYANGKGSLVVAAAGNDGSSTKVYPAACTGAIAVGNTTNNDTRSGTSNFGTWVDLAAPGTNIWSTVPTDTCTLCDSSGYRRVSGTSMSSPMVAGAAAVLLSRQNLTNAELEERLKRTAKKLPGLNLGAGRIDLFEAVFNGSFEEGNLALWQKQGTVASFDMLNQLTPQHRERMGYVSTGPADAQVAGGLTQFFQIQQGVTTLPLTFTYAFISEEFPEFVGTQFNDAMTISLEAPGGSVTTLASEEINSSSYVAITGLDFPGGDDTVGWTGWKTCTASVPVAGGSGNYKLFLTDAGDSIYDTVVLIDHIQFKADSSAPACQP